jgi:hypothetical protein
MITELDDNNRMSYSYYQMYSDDANKPYMNILYNKMFMLMMRISHT